MPEVTNIDTKYDVLVAGGGNAAMCAAIEAARAGGRVLVLEVAPKDYRGGNTRHTRNMRIAHDAATETLTGPYPVDEFLDDLLAVTKGATDEPLARLLLEESLDTAIDMHFVGNIVVYPSRSRWNHQRITKII